MTAEEDQEIRKRAAECGKTVSGFLRAAALGKNVNSLTDDRVLKKTRKSEKGLLNAARPFLVFYGRQLSVRTLTH
ncbi:plasmid mobilization protein [Shigella sonnei]